MARPSGCDSGTTSRRAYTKQVIQKFIEQEALAKQQVEATRAKIEAFEVVFPRSE
jgi:hypothetical protein